MTDVRKFVIRRQKSSVHQEETLATKLDGRRVAGSGNQPGLKGDVKTSRWLIEAKQSSGTRFSLTLGLLRKIELEAIRAHRAPVMVIEMAGRSYAVLKLEDFMAVKDFV